MISISFRNAALGPVFDAMQPKEKIKKVNRALNNLGFEFRKEYNVEISSTFNLRNKHMITGTGVAKVSLDSPLSRSKVEVGTTRKINLHQELGGQRRGSAGRYPISLKAARKGKSINSDLSTRSRMDRLHGLPVYRGSGKKGIAQATQEAGEKKQKFFVLELRKNVGIYSFKNVKKKKGLYRGKLSKLYDLSHHYVNDPSVPVMGRLTEKYIKFNLPRKLDPIFNK